MYEACQTFCPLRQPLAHYASRKCNGETYLHILAKNVFVLMFREHQREGTPLPLLIPNPSLCPVAHEEGKTCVFGNHCTGLGLEILVNRKNEFPKEAVNLAPAAATIRSERKDGTFIPDVVIEDGDLKIYIEIKVKSGVSEEKVRTGIRIWEINVGDERTIDLIRGGRLNELKGAVYNFKMGTVSPNPPPSCKILENRLCEERLLRRQETARVLREQADQQALENTLDELEKILAAPMDAVSINASPSRSVADELLDMMGGAEKKVPKLSKLNQQPRMLRDAAERVWRQPNGEYSVWKVQKTQLFYVEYGDELYGPYNNFWFAQEACLRGY